MRLTNEILQGVKAIKSYNWEKSFLTKLTDIRNAELAAIMAASNTRAVFTSILNAAPSFVAAITLGVYALLGNRLDSTKVFTALALFNQLRFPLIFLPVMFNTLADGKISLWRLTNFLLADEIEDYVETSTDTSSLSHAIAIEKGAFSWRSHASNETARGELADVNLSIKKGELVAIVGPVGSGKSTLLASILGELHKANGRVEVNGRVAYIPQASWIPNESIRNAILFGKEINWRRYRNTLLACGLSKDLNDFEQGDMTEIGEKGTNLSGGQKQRISIARAVYDDADIYIFDDPLSALDTEVGMRVFRDCVKNLLSTKTRILVTHQLNILPEVDRILIMGNAEDGSSRIVDQGSFSELIARGHDLSKSFIDIGQREGHDDYSEQDSMDGKHISSTHDEGPHENEAATSAYGYGGVASSTEESTEREDGRYLEVLSSTVGLVDLCHGPDCDVVDASEGEPVAKLPPTIEVKERVEGEPFTGVGSGDAVLTGGLNTTPVAAVSGKIVQPNQPVAHGVISKKSIIRLMTEEERGEGAVSLKIYGNYLKAAKSPLLVLGLLASLLLANASQLGQQWIVAAWSADTNYHKRPLGVYLFGVTFAASLVAFFNWTRTLISYVFGTNASRTIHTDLASSVLRAPLSFFESTPIGRLVQRFSKDLDQIDQQLPSSFGQLVASSIAIASAVFAISLVTPSFLLYMFPVFSIYLVITNNYRSVARELKRLDSLTRSPIYTHFGEALGGLPVIRSFRRQMMYLRSNEYKIDDNMSAYVGMKLVDRWLSVRLEILGNLVVFCSAVLAIVAGPRGGAAGISLNNALSVTSLLNWAVRNGVDTESLMNSVERVMYTARETPAEKAGIVDNIPASAFTPTLSSQQSALPASDHELSSSGWPWRGGITLQGVVMSYREDFEPVLRGVDLQILPGECVGIVGRTGSGKSSLLRALLRLTELREGRVLPTQIIQYITL